MTHVTYFTHDVILHDIILLINKVLSKEDPVLIKVLRVGKGYSANKIMTEFLGRNWSLASLKCLLHQIDTTGSGWFF